MAKKDPALRGLLDLLISAIADISDIKPYLRILVITPAPTVRPPSRIANRVPALRAIGFPSNTLNFALSPGITISTPSGRIISPVTSVVRMKNCGL